MTLEKQIRVGDQVNLPAPFSEITGQVTRVHGTGPRALVTVEYPLDAGSSETLTAGFVASQLTPATSAVA